MSFEEYNKPSDRFRFRPDFTKVNGNFIMILLIAAILFGVILILRFYI